MTIILRSNSSRAFKNMTVESVSVKGSQLRIGARGGEPDLTINADIIHYSLSDGDLRLGMSVR